MSDPATLCAQRRARAQGSKNFHEKVFFRAEKIPIWSLESSVSLAPVAAVCTRSVMDEVLDLNQSVDEDVPPCCAELQRRLEGEMKRCDTLSRNYQV